MIIFLQTQNEILQIPVILFHPPYLHAFYGYWTLWPFVLAPFHGPVGFSSCPVFLALNPLWANLYVWNQDDNFCTQTQLWMQPIPLLLYILLTFEAVVKRKDISWCHPCLSAVHLKVQKFPRILPCSIEGSHPHQLLHKEKMCPT